MLFILLVCSPCHSLSDQVIPPLVETTIDQPQYIYVYSRADTAPMSECADTDTDDTLGRYVPAWENNSGRTAPDISEEAETLRAWYNTIHPEESGEQVKSHADPPRILNSGNVTGTQPWALQEYQIFPAAQPPEPSGPSHKYTTESGEALIAYLKTLLGQSEPKQSQQGRLRRTSTVDIDCVACHALPPVPSSWRPFPRPHPQRRVEHTVKLIDDISTGHPDYLMVNICRDQGMLMTISVGESCPMYRRTTILNANEVAIPDVSRWLLEHGVDARTVSDLEVSPDNTAALRCLKETKGTAKDRRQAWSDYSTLKHIDYIERLLRETQVRERQNAAGR